MLMLLAVRRGGGPWRRLPAVALGLVLLLGPVAARARAQAARGAATGVTAPRVYAGRDGALDVIVPRIDTSIAAGHPDEGPWSRAVILTGFSDYSPVDGRPASDSTEVLVWYSATAIHFGIRAWEPHGAVHATLAQRDHIDADDFVQVLLDTFREKRRAFVFAANPLGVQADGTRTEGDFGDGMPHEAFGAGPSTNVDLNPDFRFGSKGRVTPWGYEVELTIPFASLRYGYGPQTWGVQIVRRVQHSGYQQTWTPARRGHASFLAQSGTLRGLTNLRRGLVLEVTPELTARAERDSPAGWASGARAYRADSDIGSTLRWALTPGLTLNGTVRPDFSQIEADATQLATDIRFAVAYPEKRPFFTDGIEEFETPNQLVYTRRIVRPDAAAKLTGRVGGAAVALLSAVDQRDATASVGHPLVNVLRVRRDLSAGSAVGATITDRETRDGSSRLASLDLRAVFAGLYTAQLQLAGSETRTERGRRSAALWQAVADRTGRRFGFRYDLTGIGPAFDAAVGFVPRVAFVRLMLAHRATVVIAPGSTLETWVVRPTVVSTWRYDDFFARRRVLEQHQELESVVTFRGGWSIGVTPVTELDAFDPAAYAQYRIVRAGPTLPDTLPFIPGDPVRVYGAVVSAQTPEFRGGSATVFAGAGRDVDFLETAPARRSILSASLNLRPTQQLRLVASYQHDTFRRWSDGSTVFSLRIPRLKADYQLTTTVFVRVVGQYEARHRDALRDPRTALPILVKGDAGYAPATIESSNTFRADALFSYQPAPGTVFFLGYGSSLAEPEAFSFRRLDRTADGFFVKVSYLMRSGTRT